MHNGQSKIQWDIKNGQEGKNYEFVKFKQQLLIQITSQHDNYHLNATQNHASHPIPAMQYITWEQCSEYEKRILKTRYI